MCKGCIFLKAYRTSKTSLGSLLPSMTLHLFHVFSQLKMDGVKRDEKAILLVDDRQEYSVKVRIHVAEG
jgi:hypothetical protein